MHRLAEVVVKELGAALPAWGFANRGGQHRADSFGPVDVLNGPGPAAEGEGARALVARVEGFEELGADVANLVLVVQYEHDARHAEDSIELAEVHSSVELLALLAEPVFGLVVDEDP